MMSQNSNVPFPPMEVGTSTEVLLEHLDVICRLYPTQAMLVFDLPKNEHLQAVVASLMGEGFRPEEIAAASVGRMTSGIVTAAALHFAARAIPSVLAQAKGTADPLSEAIRSFRDSESVPL